MNRRVWTLVPLRCVSLVATLALVASLSVPGDAWAEPRSKWSEAGVGTGAVIATIFYSPAKLIVAVAGTLTAGLAYVLTGFDSQPSNRILNSSLRGDYTVTAANLRGEQPLTFIGRDPEADPYAFE
jgi:hypothetical protein